MGFDPGSTTFGISVMEIDRNKNTSKVIHTQTIDATKLFKRSENKRYIIVRGERDLRIELIREEIRKALLKWKPEVVAAEAPFLNRRQVTAFEALVEVRTMIRSVVWEYEQNIKIVFVDPIRVKNYIGVSHIKTTKEDMYTAVHAYYDSRQKNNVLADADEHAIDATAVCHFYYRSVILGDCIESTKKKKKRGKNAGDRSAKGVTGQVSRRSSRRSSGDRDSGNSVGSRPTPVSNRKRVRKPVATAGAVAA